MDAAAQLDFIRSKLERKRRKLVLSISITVLACLVLAMTSR
ncbi:hypothetical protein ACFL27_26135 [candidate division CSSED10-310 bacterium]|uniref:Uncharacterized protein n=1 Tax=candidate division CSSED10-310 bacterium TaxID=2855610 RepID=A0ABV6Z5Q1_UNCC1